MTERRYFRIALLARPVYGRGSFSVRVREALEACGHTVFAFSPHTHPHVFEGGEADFGGLRRFLEVQELDCVLVADGVRVRPCAGVLPERTAIGLLCQDEEEVRSVDSVGGALARKADFVLAVGAQAARAARDSQCCNMVEEVRPLVDRAYVSTPLANTVAYGPGIVCVQDGTPERIAAMRAAADRAAAEGLSCDVRCAGEGWPDEWRIPGSSSALVYALRSSQALVLFCDGTDGCGQAAWPADALVALALADGCRVAAVGGPLADSYYGDRIDSFESGDAALDWLMDALASRHVADEEAAASDSGEGEDPLLELELNEALGRVREDFFSHGVARMPGCSRPRTVVCVLGYFGMGNFGDEYILATLDRRIRSFREGSTVIAVSEHPDHTLLHRGVYAVPLADKQMLDAALAYASCALVVAGLLFDQGIRWTMGKAELLSDTAYPDIPGIAGYTALASLNDSQVVFYGIGAGPLEFSDSRRLVKLIARMGALYVARDDATGDLLESCGILSKSVSRMADTAFLGYAPKTRFVDEWLAEAEVSLDGHRLIAVSIRGYDGLPKDFAHRVAAALDMAAEQYENARFALCVLDPADKGYASAIREAMERGSRAFEFDAGGAVEPVADLLARAHAGFSMRYHCSLLVNCFGKPCVGLDYLPKVASLFNDMGCADLLLPTGASAEEMGRKLVDMLADYDGWCQVVQRRSALLAEKSAAAERLLAKAVAGHAAEKQGYVRRAFFLYDAAESERDRRSLREQAAQARAEADGLRAQLDTTAAELRELRESRTFRVGRAIMRFPAWCKDSLRARRS